MPEGERTKSIKRPEPDTSQYLPDDFADTAPVENGVDELMDWLDENLPKAIKEAIEDQKAITEIAKLSGDLKDIIEELYKDRYQSIMQPLWRYADYHRKIFLAEDNWKTKAQAAKQLGKIDMSPKGFRERQNGVKVTLSDAGFDNEVKIIDSLFEQASAISGSSPKGMVIEGQATKVS